MFPKWFSAGNALISDIISFILFNSLVFSPGLLVELCLLNMGPNKKGDPRGGPKPGTKQAKAAADTAGSAKKAQDTPEEPKKPSVKEVIGGASWTGKLPVNMLSEHCQKQKWEKPEYTMVRQESETKAKC